jgi:hypothetical protein
MPGKNAPDTPDARVAYMGNVLGRVPGEPPINRAKALALLRKLRDKIAENASIEPSAIEAKVGDAAGSLFVAPGTMARILVRGEPYPLPACSEGILTTSMVAAEATHEEFAAAGVRGILCKSDGCVAIMDLRPTTPGGGVYGGSNCVSMEQFIRLGFGR